MSVFKDALSETFTESGWAKTSLNDRKIIMNHKIFTKCNFISERREINC